MLSSTYEELKDHRGAVSQAALGLGMFPIDMANDSANPDKDLIDASLAKVEEADAYVGLISYRYGQIVESVDRNPRNLSLTELEFERAEERGIPICMFIMHPDYPVPQAKVRAEAATHDKLEAFIARAKKGRIYAEFKSVDDLKAKVLQTLTLLEKKLEKTGADASAPIAAPSPPASEVPAPPALFAKPPYIPGYDFQGRVKELAAIRDWAGSSDPVLLFEAIGGMGKSMVTWEWVTKHAAADRQDWAGILWYSFYERGADMRDFCITALSYMLQLPAEELAHLRSHELAGRLLGLIRSRPWLLVLDGLERVLVEYHRSDAAQLLDEEVRSRLDMSGRRSNACIRPEDEELLRQLCSPSLSKILVSSRLTPRAFLNPTGVVLPTVRRFQLLGLDPRDAETMLRAVGVRGDADHIQRYLEDQFGCHPLVVGVVGGLVRAYMQQPGDFDRWVVDPEGGAAVDLANPDIRQRQNHILKLAFDGLDDLARELLTRIAIIANAVEWDALAALNPALVAAPELVMEPEPPEEDTELPYLEMRLANAETATERVELERRLARRRVEIAAEYEDHARAYAAYQRDLAAWTNAPERKTAVARLNAALNDLDERGLLQCDRDRGTFDLHPVVRGYAVMSLSEERRALSGEKVADYFASRSSTGFDLATCRAELLDGIQVVQAFNLAGKLDRAWEVLKDLARAMHRLELYYEELALLRPFFPNGWRKPSARQEIDGIATVASLCLEGTRLFEDAVYQDTYAISEMIQSNHVSATILTNHAIGLTSLRQYFLASRVLDLAELTLKSSFSAHLLGTKVDFLCEIGKLKEARALADRNKHLFRDPPKWERLATANLIGARLRLLYDERKLTKTAVSKALDDIHSYGYLGPERALRRLIGNWHLRAGRFDEAEAAFARGIEMAHEAGFQDMATELRRGLALVKLGKVEAGQAIAAATASAELFDAQAELYLALGDREHAREHALAGYRLYWAEGPLYSDYWRLQTCRKVLEALAEPLPEMKPFDPVTIPPLDYEADVRRLLARKP